MNENERLYEQYEDVLFVLLMNKVAEETGKALMRKTKNSLQTQMRPFPKR